MLSKRILHIIELRWSQKSFHYRTDPEKSRYTGALCGLGADPRTGYSLSPDHDIEVSFDTNIDVTDLLQVCVISSMYNCII